MSLTRRRLIASSAASPLILLGQSREIEAADELPPPKFHLSMNLEIIFPRSMPYEKRLEEVAKVGAKRYGFWNHAGKNLDAMLEVHHKYGMTCDSITGAPKTGGSSGLTKPGMEGAFLEDVEKACEVANRFGAENLITFVGAVQTDVPAETQHAQIIAGLKKAGEIAKKYNVYITLEPLNRVESPKMTMITSKDAFRYCAEADHPHVKVDYDMYHRQLGEGNVTQMLKEGLTKGYIRFVEVGDVPGRKEPGSGEMNYKFIFDTLRRLGYSGAVGMEHGTTTTVQNAWDATRKLSGLAD